MIIDLTTAVDRHELAKRLQNQENRYLAAGHIGTHLDTYQKSNIPLEYFRCPGVLLDVSDICETREIGIGDAAGVTIPENGFVLIRTARSEAEAYGTEAYFSNHPQVSQEAIEYLLRQKIRFIGIDCSGIRRGKEHEPADRLCEENGVYVIENLSNLNQLKGTKEITVYVLWLPDEKATGLPCRVIAEFSE